MLTWSSYVQTAASVVLAQHRLLKAFEILHTALGSLDHDLVLWSAVHHRLKKLADYATKRNIQHLTGASGCKDRGSVAFDLTCCRISGKFRPTQAPPQPPARPTGVDGAPAIDLRCTPPCDLVGLAAALSACLTRTGSHDQCSCHQTYVSSIGACGPAYATVCEDQRMKAAGTMPPWLHCPLACDDSVPEAGPWLQRRVTIATSCTGLCWTHDPTDAGADTQTAGQVCLEPCGEPPAANQEWVWHVDTQALTPASDPDKCALAQDSGEVVSEVILGLCEEPPTKWMPLEVNLTGGRNAILQAAGACALQQRR